MEETYHLFAEYQNIPSSQITMYQSDLLQIAHSPSDLHGKPMQSGYRKAGPQLRLTQAFQKWAQRGEFCDLGDIKQITQDRENIETLHFSPYQTGTRKESEIVESTLNKITENGNTMVPTNDTPTVRNESAWTDKRILS